MKQRLRHIGALLVAALLVCAAAPAAAQTVQQQNQEILNELKAIHQLLDTLASRLTAPPAAAAGRPDNRVRLSDVSGFALGRADAPLTMVEFTDLQCPFCRQFHVTAFEQIKKDYIDTGKLRYISRDFPIDQLHPLATSAARVGRCAADQGKFWEMRHLILANNSSLTSARFPDFAKELQLDMAAFTACVANTTLHDADLRKDADDAARVGVTGTPSFVVGPTIADGLDGYLLVGAQPYPTFDAGLKELLAKLPAK